MSDIEDAIEPILAPEAKSRSKPAPRGLIMAVMALLVAFVAMQGRSLYREWQTLRAEQYRLRHTEIIGYLNISPHYSFAKTPEDWFHNEGEFTLLWSGWQHGNGHQWFRVKRGELEQQQLSLPIGRDVIQAIDYPLTERGGGRIWGRIPTDAAVANLDYQGETTAYPIQVLDKVCVINDQVGNRPFLVSFNPLSPGGPVHVYDPMLKGHRVTMGVSGYTQNRKVILYDRGSESLWIEDDARRTLRAIAGPSRGCELGLLCTPTLEDWGDWQSEHPQGRLLVGADRSKVVPID